MKHVRLIIDEITWFDGIPGELTVQQSDDTLVLKIGPKRQPQQLSNIFGRRQPGSWRPIEAPTSTETNGTME